jgi:hypothetical protein
MLQRAHHLLDRLGGNPRIERRAVKLGVTEQNLDHADIDVLLQEMSGKAVPQRVQRDIALDPGRLCGGVASAIELTWSSAAPDCALETASLGVVPPLGAQQFEQARRQHHVAILAAFALLHADDHPLAVDVTDLE